MQVATNHQYQKGVQSAGRVTDDCALGQTYRLQSAAGHRQGQRVFRLEGNVRRDATFRTTICKGSTFDRGFGGVGQHLPQGLHRGWGREFLA